MATLAASGDNNLKAVYVALGSTSILMVLKRNIIGVRALAGIVFNCIYYAVVSVTTLGTMLSTTEAS